MAKRILGSLVAVGIVAALSGPARAQDVQLSLPPLPFADPLEGQGLVDQYAPPIPPGAEGQPVAGPGGSYCYAGAHPVDTRVAAGTAWDDSPGVHTHFYAPFDSRLFTVRDGCYYFVGDPTDFGYRGQVFNYYGAHPVQELNGGGWCFMVAGHVHAWRPWSQFFVTVGPFAYWQGGYDNYYQSYYPYYSHYYRSYYPRYYGGGRFGRGHATVAPRFDRVPGHYRGQWRVGNPPPDQTSIRGWQSGNRTYAPPSGSSMTPPGFGGGNPAPPPGNWSGNGSGWRGGAPGSVAPPVVPSPGVPARAPGSGSSFKGGGGSSMVPSRAPSAPVQSGSTFKSGTGSSPGRVGGAKGGWRN